MDFQQAVSEWNAHRALHEQNGIYLSDVKAYMPPAFKKNFALAMDALPTLSTNPNSGVPAWLTTMIDPDVLKILFAPNKAAVILGEQRKGTWTDKTAVFPVVEHTGEVSSYGDYAENGRAGANTNWPQRQSYLFQTVKEYGDLEVDLAGTAKINWVSEIDESAATNFGKFLNLTYFFGVLGLQNYGLLNDPNLSAALTPATKASGNARWITLGVVTATANEIFTDIQSLFTQLVSQSTGLIEADAKMCLAMSPTSAVALTTTNTFNVNVYDLLKKNFPNIRFETAVQYGARTASNPQGVLAGEFVQLIAETVEGKKTGYTSFNEKMRSHPIVRALSSYKQKLTGGTWGSIIRIPMAFTSMVGV